MFERTQSRLVLSEIYLPNGFPLHDMLMIYFQASHSSGSRTPTPRAESTTMMTTPTDRPPRLGSVTPDLETTSNSSSNALGSEDFATFLINNTESAAAALLNTSPTLASVRTETSTETNSQKQVIRANSLSGGKGMLSPSKPGVSTSVEIYWGQVGTKEYYIHH